MNYDDFKKECRQALKDTIINQRDFLLLTKIGKAIYEEDASIEMHLVPYDSANSHKIKCLCFSAENWEDKIKKALKEAYIYHRNVSLGWHECSITVTSDTWSKSVSEILSEHRDKQMYKPIAKRRKATSQFGDLVDWIVKLAEKGKYEKCDGIIEDYIRNYDTSQLISEKEMLKDLQIVIDDIDNDAISKIAKKYNATTSNVESILKIKIRCFDRDYLYKDGFFDFTTEDHEIIKRKLKGEPFDDVEPFKFLSEIEL